MNTELITGIILLFIGTVAVAFPFVKVIEVPTVIASTSPTFTNMLFKMKSDLVLRYTKSPTSGVPEIVLTVASAPTAK